MKIYTILKKWLNKQNWYEPWRRWFWSSPDRQKAIKVTFVIAAICVPFIWRGHNYIASTLALGILADALSETDDHPRGRIAALLLKVLGFGISGFAVMLLKDNIILLGIGLALSSVVFILIGGLSERFRGITFGAILVGIYAMMSVDANRIWYMPALLLSAGALFHGLFSLFLLHLNPYRLLEEQLARGFRALATYQKEKAQLFMSDTAVQQTIRNNLTIKNVRLVESLDQCRALMRSYADIEGENVKLRRYLHYFMQLQALHERATSTHERYDFINHTEEEKEMLEGLGQVIYMLGEASELFSYSLLVHIPYKPPTLIGWSVKSLEEKQEYYHLDTDHPLRYIVQNLKRSSEITGSLTKENISSIMPRLAKDTRTIKERFVEQLSFQHPRMRHAIRLSICLTLSYVVSESFNLVQGDWVVLTALVVCQSTFSETRRRFFQRVFGTIFGVVLGVSLTRLLPTMAGQIIFLLTSAYLFLYWLRRRYSYAVIFITTYVLCVFNLVSQEGVGVMESRLFDTIIGSVITIITVRFLWPDFQGKRIPSLLNVAFRANASYLQNIIKAHVYKLPEEDFDYRVARREAHRADNALALAWQNMRLEPKQNKKFRENLLKLTYHNHALISYLSALGVRRENGDMYRAGLVEVADEILAVMKTIQIPMDSDVSNRVKEQKTIINRLNELQQNSTDSVVVQQARILAHVAELSLKLQMKACAYYSEIDYQYIIQNQSI
ncbi:MAG: FUSC family membrane protein [Mangrovibacterium sp.]